MIGEVPRATTPDHSRSHTSGRTEKVKRHKVTSHYNSGFKTRAGETR